MSHRRADVIAAAIELLDRGGLAALTMRRLAADLDVQPSALYHHVANKQTLLAAVADELLSRADWSATGPWPDQAVQVCDTLRATLLAWRDGAELTATVWSFGLGANLPEQRLVEVLAPVGEVANTAARTLLHFVYGHATDEQTRSQAAQVGAIEDVDRADDFEIGLGMVMAGVQVAAALGS